MSPVPSLRVTKIKAFVPSKNFELSKQFYKDIGFTMASEGGGVAYFRFDDPSFLLQDFCAEAVAENFMMHMLVEDVEAWWNQVNESGVVAKYGVKLSKTELQPWRMRDFCLTDPSGVLWRLDPFWNLANFLVSGRVRSFYNKVAVPTSFESAQLNLQLFDLRRESVLREARAWFVVEFNPESFAELMAVVKTERHAAFRMVLRYWDMAASYRRNRRINRQSPMRRNYAAHWTECGVIRA